MKKIQELSYIETRTSTFNNKYMGNNIVHVNEYTHCHRCSGDPTNRYLINAQVKIIFYFLVFRFHRP